MGGKKFGFLRWSIKLWLPSPKNERHSTPFHSGEFHCCFGSLFVQKFSFQETLGEEFEKQVRFMEMEFKAMWYNFMWWPTSSRSFYYHTLHIKCCSSTHFVHLCLWEVGKEFPSFQDKLWNSLNYSQALSYVSLFMHLKLDAQVFLLLFSYVIWMISSSKVAISMLIEPSYELDKKFG